MLEEPVAPRDRVNLVYKPVVETMMEEIELPLTIVMVGDYLQRSDDRALEDRAPIGICSDDFDTVFSAQRLALDLDVPDMISREPGASQSVSLRFARWSDLTPEGIARQVPAICDLLEARASLGDRETNRAHRDDIDRRLSAQVDAVLHHPAFQRLESSWRALRFVVERVDFRENIRVAWLHCTKHELRADFEDTSGATRSALYKALRAVEARSSLARPVGVVVADYEFGPNPQDVWLLSQCAAVAALTQAPFLAAASPEMVGATTWESLPEVDDLGAVFTAPEFARWRAFRERDEARYVGLCLPRFLLRAPYRDEAGTATGFSFCEVFSSRVALWGNAAAALVTRIAAAFARDRQCINFVGARGDGVVAGLPRAAHGEAQEMLPVEASVSARRERELSEHGFIGLVAGEASDRACFVSASSCAALRDDDPMREDLGRRLGTQLPHLFMLTRFAQYLLVVQRQRRPSWEDRADLERVLTEWLSQYVARMDDPPRGVRCRRPLREMSLSVDDVDGEPTWWRMRLSVRPHFTYAGAQFTLSLAARIDLT